MELVVIKAELEWGGGSGINDGANGCAVETVEADGTASLSSVFITLRGAEGRDGERSTPHKLSILSFSSQVASNPAHPHYQNEMTIGVVPQHLNFLFTVPQKL